MHKRTDQMDILQRIEWLENIVGIYGFLLAEKGLTVERVLKATVGNDLWLDGVNDEHWDMLWNEIAPVLLRHAQGRGDRVRARE